MNFTYEPEQEALRDSVRRFVEREYDWDSRLRIIRSAEGAAPEHWATFAELGWLGAGLPEGAGGFGGGAVENALIAEELGRALVTEPFAAHAAAMQALAAIHGPATAPLIEAAIMGDRRILLAFQEPGAGGDWRTVQTRIEDGALFGAKVQVEGGGGVDTLILPAMENGRLGLYLADPRAAGVTCQVYRTLDNRRVADFSFDGAPAERLASGAAAEEAMETAIDHGLICLCAEALGVMDAALWATRDYLKVRRQFGVPIGSFQALQHRMADMLIEVEMARSLLFQALGAIEAGQARERAAAVSAAMSHVADRGVFVGAQAIQLHGGIGITEELNISHFYRRLYVIARQMGDADFHTARFAEARDAAERSDG